MLNPGKTSFRSKAKQPMPERVVVVAPPSPVSMYCAQPTEDGTVMTYMFPSAGTIRNVTVCIDSLGEDDTALLEVGPHGAGSLERVEIQGGLQMLSFEFRVVRGDRIVVKALSDVSDVWVAFEYQVDKPKDAGD